MQDDGPGRPGMVKLQPTLEMPLKRDGTASGGIGYTKTTVPYTVGGTAVISADTTRPSGGSQARGHTVGHGATVADIYAEFHERAAICEFDGGLPQHEAEAQALADIYDSIVDGGGQHPGILGELIAAARRRHAPAVDQIVRKLGIDACRAPMWGFAHIVCEGETYRLADGVEFGDAALIVPAFEHGGLVDLVAEPVMWCGRYTRLGIAPVLNLAAIEIARATGEPLLVFESVRQWLRGGCHGAVVLDWRQAARELDGVLDIRCSASMAATAYRWTRNCWPQPTIAVPSPKGDGHAG